MKLCVKEWSPVTDGKETWEKRKCWLQGENAGYKDFPLFSQCVQRAPFQPFPKQALVFTWLQYKSFENTVRKREIAQNEQFLLFPLCFPLVNFPPFSSNLNLSSQPLSILKICHLGKGYESLDCVVERHNLGCVGSHILHYPLQYNS